MWILWHTCHMWRVYVTFDLIVSAFLSLGFVVASLLRLKVDEADWDGLTGTPNFHVLCQEIQNVELVSSPRSLNRYRVAKYMTTASLISECVQICSMPFIFSRFRWFFQHSNHQSQSCFLGHLFRSCNEISVFGGCQSISESVWAKAPSDIRRMFKMNRNDRAALLQTSHIQSLLCQAFSCKFTSHVRPAVGKQERR